MSTETQAPDPPAGEPASRAASSAVLVAGTAITAFGLLAIASHQGWLPKVGGKAAGFDPDKAGAITRPEPGPPRSSVPLASALLPGETLIAEPQAAPPAGPLMPHYSDPVVPRPAPPRPAETAPQAAPAPAPTPAPPRWVRQPPERAPAGGIPIRPVPAAPRYAESRHAETRSTRARCNRCGVVTEISPYIDEWDVHVRFEDGTRRVLRYPTPPNVGRGDRVVLENGRLNLD
jgi:hypothetical protein